MDIYLWSIHVSTKFSSFICMSPRLPVNTFISYRSRFLEERNLSDRIDSDCRDADCEDCPDGPSVSTTEGEGEGASS